jgi:UDP-galactopyranose mutase
MYDYLIVGSGLFGATFAYRAKEMGKKCLVIDKRPHLGGNVYCENVEGINVHKYGAHIFHTNNKDVWNFVNSIVPFNRYTNSPVANYHGKLFNLPFNMNTFYQMWGVTTPEQAVAKIEEQKAEAVAKMKAEGVLEPRNLEEQGLCLVGKDIFEKLIKEYTEKQWGRKCSELPAFIIKRLPVRLVFDNNYFNDAYQGIPIGGYNKLIEGLLENTTTITGLDFFNPNLRDACIVTPKNRNGIKDVLDINLKEVGVLRTNIQLIGKKEWRNIARFLVYTGPIDEYFDFCYGKLDWRTVSFKTRILNIPNYQGNAVVNYTSHEQPYTRVIEHKHFEMFGQSVYDCPKTVVSEEYSTEYKEGMEQYYPVNDDKNNQLAEQYRHLAEREKNIIFGGRLAEYKYYDMAPIIEKVLTLSV